MDRECSFKVPPETERFLCERLLDEKQPISERFRVLFSLRNLRGVAPRTALIQATRDTSNLLAHEAAFALGQMQDAEAIPALEAVLNDLSLHPIVRHEAAEALGAIGLQCNAPFLKNSLATDPAPEVRETCELALSRIDGLKNTSVTEASPFLSVDPAAPAACSSVEELREVLLNEDKSMYERYSALFALRNLGQDEAVSAIVESLGANSALLRHEVAYVLGQLQNKKASDALSQVLRDVNEHPMVRHEAAGLLVLLQMKNRLLCLRNSPRTPSPSSHRAVKLLSACLSLKNRENPSSTFSWRRLKLHVKVRISCFKIQWMVEDPKPQHNTTQFNYLWRWK
ncbi:hypothetical protein SASPL_123343 [Salvia splendens]|uniref:Deoxyhypusine hydroxylase n=1 Tax=Salvia splendens TaxID=180675 RepID=A0A8X8XN24_SALSN|nr:hypothetical protein SASPL_123343 [Salvia splendens]